MCDKHVTCELEKINQSLYRCNDSREDPPTHETRTQKVRVSLTKDRLSHRAQRAPNKNTESTQAEQVLRTRTDTHRHGVKRTGNTRSRTAGTYWHTLSRTDTHCLQETRRKNERTQKSPSSKTQNGKRSRQNVKNRSRKQEYQLPVDCRAVTPSGASLTEIQCHLPHI